MAAGSSPGAQYICETSLDGIEYLMSLRYFAGLLAGLLSCACASAMDCSQARQAIEQLICSQPRLQRLDSQLNQSYAALLAARPAQAHAWKLDQLDWLTIRNATNFQERMPASVRSERIAWLYRERISLLQAALSPPLPRLPLLEDLQAHVDQLPALFSAKHPMATLRRWVPLLPFHAIAALPQPPDPMLRNALEGSQELRTYQQGTLGIGAVLDTGGSGQCQLWNLFHVDGGKTRRVATPAMLDQLCAPYSGTLVDYRGVTYALSVDISDRDIQIQATALDGDDWTQSSTLELHFAKRLGKVDAYCKGSDCASLQSLAKQQISRLRTGHTLGQAPPVDHEQAVIRSWLAPRKAVLDDLSPMTSMGLPQALLQQIEFDTSSTIWLQPDGATWLVGRAGHPATIHGVWSSWMTGFWQRQDDRLVPRALFIWQETHGQLLHALILPSAPGAI